METKSMNVESLYVAPAVEVLEVQVEAGFAGSTVEGPSFGDNGSDGVDLP